VPAPRFAGFARVADRPRPVRYLLALVAVGLATLLRLAIDPVVHDQIPYYFYAVGVVAATQLGGIEGGLLGALAAGLVGNYLFVAPRYEWVPHRTDWIALGTFWVVSVCLVALVNRLTRAERELRQLHQQTNAILEHMPVGVMVAGADEIIAFKNSAFDRMLGMSSRVGEPLETVRANRPYSTFRFLNGQRIPTDERPLSRALRGEVVRDEEVRIVYPSGHHCDISTSAVPVRAENGRIVAAVVTTTDISDRRRVEAELLQREEQLNAATLAAEVGVWTWVPGSSQISVGANWRGLFGVAPSVEPTFDTWTSAVHPEDRERAVAALNAAWQNRQEFNVEYRVLLPDGTERWLVDRGRAYHDRDGVDTGVAGVNLDITKIKSAEAALRHANEALGTANRIKDEFLATLSHELRTPLNAIVGWAGMLLKGGLAPEVVRKGHEAIARSAESQRSLIEDVLDVSRIVSGRLRLQTGQIDLAVPLRGALETLRPIAEDKNVTVTTAFAVESAGVWGDSSRLEQVFVNLLSNALKFAREDGHVTVTLDRIDYDVRVTVDDDGIGIAPELLPHIFERFRQADSSSTRAHMGLGLGLAIVRHLVELHGGTVRADSAGRGKGARFTVRLPHHHIHERRHMEAVGDRLVDAAAQSAVSMQSLCGVRVLLVDDQPDAREVGASVLRQAGALVEVAESGRDALLRLEHGAPDVMLIDIAMPEMDGYSLLDRIRRERAHAAQAPAIAFTAYAREEDRRMALTNGFRMHIAKPVEPDALVRAVAMVVDRN
jgi:PAS domain S-box-containing protein